MRPIDFNSIMRIGKRPFLTSVFVLAVVLCTYTVCEGVYRLKEYRRIRTEKFGHLVLDEPIYEPSPAGYRYRPNLDLTAHWYAEGWDERQTKLRTNELGLVSRRSAKTKKAPGEFRIAILGDSLTACIHNNLPWTDLVEDKLNGRPEMLRRFKAKHFTVLNLGLDGLGIAQMPDVLDERAKELHPDLIVVNFITADIYRRPTWRALTRFGQSKYDYLFLLGCTTKPAELENPNCDFSNVLSIPAAQRENPSTMAGIREEISEQIAKRRSWFTPYPELLSSLLKGNLENWIGKNPYLPISSTIADRAESIRLSSEAIRRINQRYPQTVYTHLPTYWEIIHNAIPALAGELMNELPNIQITPLLSYLPQATGQEEVNTWINFPYDMHWSDKGAEIIAESMTNYLETLQSARPGQIPG